MRIILGIMLVFLSPLLLLLYSVWELTKMVWQKDAVLDNEISNNNMLGQSDLSALSLKAVDK